MLPENNAVKTDKIKWGIIGCGDVTEVKSGPAFNKVENSELVAVMRRTGNLAKDYASRHVVPRWYDDANRLIHDPEVNAVYIATPPSSHMQYTIQALEAGKPVYVEKPMAMNVEECEQMVETSRKTGQKLFAAYYRRSLPYFLKIRDLIVSREIGDVRTVNISMIHPPKPEESSPTKDPGWRVDPKIAGGGHFHDLASHQFDYLDFLFGPVTSASGISKNLGGYYEADDTVNAVFEFENGVTGSGTWCFAGSKGKKTDLCEIIGKNGQITFSFFERAPILLETFEKEQTFNVDFPDHVHQPLIDLVVQDLLGKGQSPSTGETGLRATKVLDIITMG